MSNKKRVNWLASLPVKIQVAGYKFRKRSRGVLQYALNNLYKTVGQASLLSVYHPLSP